MSDFDGAELTQLERNVSDWTPPALEPAAADVHELPARTAAWFAMMLVQS